MACERARLVLGGRTERTLAPAELLDLPRGPADAFPADPYGAPDARSRTLAAAAHRAQAYLDGEVAHSAAGFEVALSLRRADGVELASGAGRGRGLYEAVRAAMAPLIRVRRIPAAPRLPPEVAAWSRTQRIDDALAALDLTFAFVQSAGGLPAECARFEALAARLGELGLEGQQACAYTLGRPAPVAAPGRSDDSAAGRALQIRIDHAVHQTVRPGDPAFLRDQLAREPTPRGRSLLAAIESCVIGSTDADAARERAIAAVQSEPSNPEGGTCNPWEQLMTLERNTRDAGAAMRAMQAWVPWNSYAWLEPAFATEGADPQALALVARAHALSPLDTQIADVLARGLLAAGDRAAARGIAAELAGGGLVVHDVERELILVRVETSEARFAAALARARKASELAPGDTGWIRAQRFEIAWHAIELAALVGRAPDVADEVVARFVDPDPTPLDANLSLVPMRIPAICALASTPARCFARFRALRPQLPGAITRDTDDFLAGAERYAERDLAGAARAWRPLISGPRLLAAMLPDAMVDAFEHTGAADLAAAVDQEVTRRAGEFGGATLGHVRAARRALARGDLALARQLAQQVTDAWSTADEPPPALAEMRQLLEAAPPGRREP
jgi:hypothetical protein